MELNDIPQRKKDILAREEEDSSIILFRPEFGMIKRLNAMGAEIWNSCDGKSTIQDIINRIVNEFPNSSSEKIRDDVLKFINTLVETGLLEPK